MKFLRSMLDQAEQLDDLAKGVSYHDGQAGIEARWQT